MRIPVSFVSHGAPTMALKHSAPLTVSFLQRLGHHLFHSTDIKAIIVISAHWETTATTKGSNPIFSINGAETPHQIYDFYGFPPQLYQIKIGSDILRGSPSMAELVKAALIEAGVHAQIDNDHGFDHGVWVPLMHMLNQSVKPPPPVIQVSLDKNLRYSDHVKLGRALRPLRDKGFLIVGSGGAVHNLGLVDFEREAENSKADSWAIQFQLHLDKLLQLPTDNTSDHKSSIVDNLTAWFQNQSNRNSVKQAHPRTEHLMPLIVAAAALHDNEPFVKVHDAMQFGCLSLAAYCSEAL